MRGFVGIGHSDSIEAAIEEATTGLRNADLLILIAPFSKAEQAASILSAKYPSVPMIGTSGASVGKGETDDDQIVVAGFAGVTVSCGLITNIGKAPIASIREFETNLNLVEPNSTNTICMEFITGSEEKTLATMNSVLSKYNLPLAGGTSYGTPLGEKNIVIYNGKLYSGSCVYAFIKNNAGKIKLLTENIYERLSKRAHFATLVDTNTKTLFQLDGTLAHEVYTEETGVEKDMIVKNMLRNPLGRAVGSDTYITATESLDMNGVMFNGKALYDNDSIYIMELGDFKQIHEETLSTAKSSTNRISFVFAFDSINRLKLFAEEDYLAEYVDSMSELGTYVSLLGNGQQYNNQQINQTLVLAIFE